MLWGGGRYALGDIFYHLQKTRIEVNADEILNVIDITLVSMPNFTIITMDHFSMENNLLTTGKSNISISYLRILRVNYSSLISSLTIHLNCVYITWK